MEETILREVRLAKLNAEIQETEGHFLSGLSPLTVLTVGNNGMESLQSLLLVSKSRKLYKKGKNWVLGQKRSPRQKISVC